MGTEILVIRSNLSEIPKKEISNVTIQSPLQIAMLSKKFIYLVWREVQAFLVELALIKVESVSYQ